MAAAAKATVEVCVVAGAAIYTGYEAIKALATLSESSDGESPYAGETPDDRPDNYKPGEQAGDKINKDDGSIWSPDKSGHADSKWKRWPNKKDRKNRKGRESVRPDGSVR